MLLTSNLHSWLFHSKCPSWNSGLLGCECGSLCKLYTWDHGSWTLSCVPTHPPSLQEAPEASGHESSGFSSRCPQSWSRSLEFIALLCQSRVREHHSPHPLRCNLNSRWMGPIQDVSQHFTCSQGSISLRTRFPLTPLAQAPPCPPNLGTALLLFRSIVDRNSLLPQGLPGSQQCLTSRPSEGPENQSEGPTLGATQLGRATGLLRKGLLGSVSPQTHLNLTA